VQLPCTSAPWKANLFQFLDDAQAMVLAEGLSRTPPPGSRGFKFKKAKDQPSQNASCEEEPSGCARLPGPTQRLVNDLRQFNYALQARPRRAQKPLAAEVVKQDTQANTTLQRRDAAKAPVQSPSPRAPTKLASPKARFGRKRVISAALKHHYHDSDQQDTHHASKPSRSNQFCRTLPQQTDDAAAKAKTDSEAPKKHGHDFALGGGFSTSQPQRNLFMFAVRLKLPLDILTTAAQLFETFAEVPASKPEWHGGKTRRKADQERSVLEDGYVTVDKFGDMLCRLFDYESPAELPKEMVMSCFKAADQNSGGQVDFDEFASWLSRHVFSEDFLLTQEEKEMRAYAREHNIGLERLDHMKHCFEMFDEDGSGVLDQNEFEQLLHLLLKIPKHLRLPKSRMDAMWAEADMDGGGAIGFEEFLIFYKKYFDPQNPSTNPVATFYRRIRPHRGLKYTSAWES